MLSSVKPWALAKVANFSLISVVGAWVRPGAEGEAAGLHPGDLARPPPPGLGSPQAAPSAGPQAGRRELAWGTYCRAWPCGSPGRGLGSSRCRAGHRPRSPSPPPTPRGCRSSLGAQETTAVGRGPLGRAPLWAGVGGALMPHALSSCLPCPSPARCFLPAQPSGPRPEVLGAQQTHRLRKSGVHGTATNSAAKLLSGGGEIRSGEVVPGQGVRRPEVLGQRAAEGVGEALGAAGRGSRQLGRFHPGADPGRPWQSSHHCPPPCTAGQGVTQSPRPAGVTPELTLGSGEGPHSRGLV